MTNDTYKILIVDDEEMALNMVYRILSCDQYTLYTASSGKDAIELANKVDPDLILLDVLMPNLDGVGTCSILKGDETTKHIPVLILTACSDRDTKLRCLRAGANDYIVKPFDSSEFRMRINHLLDFKRYGETRKMNEMLQQDKAMLEGKIRELEAALQDRYNFQNIITTSPVMKKALELAARVVVSPKTPVIIYGESGCGKEVLSRAIHVEGGGMPGGFVTFNCAAIPEEQLESELFGHVRGAFSGADQDLEGKFSQAQGGTLLLDEIGDMPLVLQDKLLRVLERRTFEKLGSNVPIPVNCRVILTTNRDLSQMIDTGRFREDLFHQINIYPITIPPLREKRDDIPLLVEHFLAVFRQTLGKPLPGISQKALNKLMTYQWPGNIRELRNCLERAALICEGPIQPEHLFIGNSRDTSSSGANTE